MDTPDQSSLTEKQSSLTATASFFDGAWLAQAPPAAVHALLAQGADLRAQDAAGRTPLHWAAGYSQTPAVVSLLLTRGADLTAQDHRGQTPLHTAALLGEPPVVSLLRARGADATLRAGGGRRPLDAAAADPALKHPAAYWRLPAASCAAGSFSSAR